MLGVLNREKFTSPLAATLTIAFLDSSKAPLSLNNGKVFLISFLK